MVEFLFGMVAGFLLWPWWGMGFFAILFVADSILCDKDNAGAGTILMIVGLGLLIWLAGDANPFALVWNNLGNILAWVILYFIIGCAWSLIKWRLYLANLVREIKADRKRYPAQTRPEDFERARDSYAKYNKARICGWIGHWPMSIAGSLLGDILWVGLCNITSWLYTRLGKAYDAIGDSAFDELEREAEIARAGREREDVGMEGNANR